LRSETQLLRQAAQVVCDVDVIKTICKADRKLQSSCARQESLQRAAGTHSVACEKRRMRSLCPDEIVASVVRWSNDYVMRGQRFERVFENRTRQVWTVAVERNGALPTRCCEVCEHRGQACRKALTFLRNYARLTRF